MHGHRSLRRAQEDRRAAGSRWAWSKRSSRTPRRAARRPLQRGDRAVPHRPVVRQRQGTGEAGDRRGARRQDQVRAEELGEDLFQLDGKHPALVHLAPALVGPPNSGVVWAGRQSLRRARAKAEAQARSRQALRQEGRAHARRGRARHLVLLRAVAVLDAGLAGRDAGARSATIRPARWSPASTSSSSGSRA